MTRWSLCTALIVPFATSAVVAGPMNFRNVTGSSINSNTAEQASNEKDIDFGDFDEDGDLDVVVAVAFSDFGARRNKLYENDGNGVFEEVSHNGNPGGNPIPSFNVNKVSRSAFLRDFDMDGHLDLWIINDQNSHNDQIFIADWTGGSFQSFLEQNNRIPAGGNTGAACSGFSADFDQDGDPDVYCGNYPNTPQDTLQSNQGTGFFTNLTSTHVPPRSDYVVDVDGADMNGDGKMDLLIANHGNSSNSVYYNDNNNAGSGIGDFHYAGSRHDIYNPSLNENSMSAGDLDNDGDMDIYASNYTSSSDRVLLNTGNDGSNRAIWSVQNILPPSVTGNTSRKATIVDLNDDSRVDVIVMKEGATNSRPTVLRNITLAGGSIELIDWTPNTAFPGGNLHKGWRAKAADVDGDNDMDIFVGGWAGDHLIASIDPVTWDEVDVEGGAIPDAYNRDANMVIGSTAPGEQDVYEITGISQTNGFLSVVTTSGDDLQVEILSAADAVLMTIDRGGVGVEEGGQYNWGTAPGTLKVRVTGIECGSALNVAGSCDIDTADFLALLAAWGPNPGHPADNNGDDVVDTTDFLNLLAGWGESSYALEVVSRNN